MNKHTIAFVAGKSGGHIIPCLTIADDLRAQHEQTRILFFSSNTPLDEKILSQDPRVSWHIMLLLSKKNKFFLITLWYAFSAFVTSFFYLCKHRPQKIITTGGIIAIPTCLAGFILRIPVIIYSLDAVPGKAIQFLAPLATSIITCFTDSKKYFPSHKCSIKSYPIKYKDEHLLITKETALQSLDLLPDKKTIVVLGGSQGSLFLNKCMENIINAFSPHEKAHIQVIHQTGSVDATNWQHFYQDNNVSAYVFSYMPNLENVYAGTDLIICRAGAGTLFEIKFFNKPCIIIPLETHTTTHQVDNAYAMSKQYPALFSVMRQQEIERNFSLLSQKIKMFF